MTRVCRVPFCGEPLVMHRLPFCVSCRIAIASGFAAGGTVGMVIGIVIGVIHWWGQR